MKKPGFTLIELLVVISIIGILAALLIANMVGIRERARDSAIKTNLGQIQSALRLYYNDKQSFPGVANTEQSCESVISSLNAPVQYLQKLTIDVPGGGACKYTPNGTLDGYTIQTTLYSGAGEDDTKSGAKCGIVSPAEKQYYVCAM